MPTFFILDYAAAFARHGQVVDLGHFEGGSFLGEATVVKVLEDKRPSRAFNNDGSSRKQQTIRNEAAARQCPLWVNFFSTCLL